MNKPKTLEVLSLDWYQAARSKLLGDEMRYVPGPGFVLEIGPKNKARGRIDFAAHIAEQDFYDRIKTLVPQALYLQWLSPFARISKAGVFARELARVRDARMDLEDNLEGLAKRKAITEEAPRLWWRCNILQAVNDGKLSFGPGEIIQAGKIPLQRAEAIYTKRETKRVNHWMNSMIDDKAAENAVHAQAVKDDAKQAAFEATFGIERL